MKLLFSAAFTLFFPALHTPTCVITIASARKKLSTLLFQCFFSFIHDPPSLDTNTIVLISSPLSPDLSCCATVCFIDMSTIPLAQPFIQLTEIPSFSYAFYTLFTYISVAWKRFCTKQKRCNVVNHCAFFDILCNYTCIFILYSVLCVFL